MLSCIFALHKKQKFLKSAYYVSQTTMELYFERYCLKKKFTNDIYFICILCSRRVFICFFCLRT